MASPGRRPHRDAPRNGSPDRPSGRDGGPPRNPSTPPVDACRNALRLLAPTPTTHAGLWLDRFLPKQPKATHTDEDKGTIQAHIKRLDRTQIPAPYLQHCERWSHHLAALGANARRAEATVRGRMIIGLGAESVLETAIHLHHTYGVPVIPGSALKGLAADYARNHLKDESWRPKPKEGDSANVGTSYRALFGDTTEAGCVIFHDALWIPPDGEERDKHPLDLDVMTVHHRDYYGTKGKSPPADSDDPNPVSFVTARGTYLIALEGPPDWTDAAMSILKRALAESGIGAKTAAGYGRLVAEYESDSERAEKEFRVAEAEAAVEATRARKADEDRRRSVDVLIADLNPGTASHNVPKILALALPEERSAAARQCVAKFTAKQLRTARKGEKSWIQQLDASVTSSYEEDPEST